MYLIISWFYSFGKISGIVPEPKLKNWIFQRDPGRDSPYGFSFSVFLFFSFSVLLTELFRNISGDISEYLRRNWKTEKEKLKNWIFQRDPGRDSPYGFSFSVFLFFSFSVFQFCLRNYSGIFPETFRNICGETEKLKNWIFQRDPGRDSPYGFSFSVFQFFCFAVFLFFSFSVFQFCLRNYSGIFAEKLKNWKTEFSREIQEEILHMDSVFQFFCFSVLWQNRAGGTG